MSWLFRPCSSVGRCRFFADSIPVRAFASLLPLDALKVALPGSGCGIKGNISIASGERIYHLPGQDYYAATRISPWFGERWFCTEDEARRAGWPRAGL